MNKLLLAGVSLVAIAWSGGSQAADVNMALKAQAGCPRVVDPYKNYACLDAYLGDDFASRFINYYRLEWGMTLRPLIRRRLQDVVRDGRARRRAFRLILSPNGRTEVRPVLV